MNVKILPSYFFSPSSMKGLFILSLVAYLHCNFGCRQYLHDLVFWFYQWCIISNAIASIYVVTGCLLPLFSSIFPRIIPFQGARALCNVSNRIIWVCACPSREKLFNYLMVCFSWPSMVISRSTTSKLKDVNILPVLLHPSSISCRWISWREATNGLCTR